MKVDIDYTKTLEQNAARYYERAKTLKKKVEGARKAIEKAKSAGTNFSVCAIDYRKLPTGRENAQEMLSKAVKESDILFFEPEAVCGDKIIVTEEANAAIEEARKHKVPSYGGYSIFGSSKKPGQKNLREAKASSITGLVSEGGITKPALLGRI